MSETARTWLLLNELRRSTRLPAAALHDLQGRLLRAAVVHAYRHVPFYRRVWDASGLDPASIRSIDDLGRLPIIDGDRVRQAVESGELLTRAVDTSSLPGYPTSGTSGRPMRVLRGPVEARLWRAAGLRMLLENGFRWRHATAQFESPPGEPHVLQRLGLARTTWIPPTLPLDDQLARLIDARAHVVVGTPTVLRRLCRALVERDARPMQPGLVVCQGEILDAGSRAAIHGALGSDPISVYGLTEVGYVAWQCEARGALHVNAELVAVEVLSDPAAAAPGTLGRVVVTDLRGRTMPLLRYDTGDLAIATAERCRCARTLPTLGPIEGRGSSTACLPDGRRVTTRAIVDCLAGTLAPDDFRLKEGAGRVFSLQVTRTAARGDGLQRAVGRLRELLDAADIRIEVTRLPQAGQKTDVFTSVGATRE